MKLYVGRLRDPIDGEKHVKLAIGETQFTRVNVDVTDPRLGEAPALHSLLFAPWQARDAVPLQAAMQSTTGELRDGLPKAAASTGPAFLRSVVAAFPYRIHTVLTDNGVQFADLPRIETDQRPEFVATASTASAASTISKAQRALPSMDQWSGRAHEPNDSLKAHVLAFVAAYNFAKHLKALRWRTPFHTICEAWNKDPSPFNINPHQLIGGPNT